MHVWQRIAPAAALLFLAACAEMPTSPMAEDMVPQMDMVGVVHHASVGGADFCEAAGLPTGCDANYSLVANEMADGRVLGQWQDSFGHGNGGFHIAVDCLAVHGNQAVVGGILTKAPDPALVGQRAITSVRDNGTSVGDPPDQITFSFVVPVDCTIDPTVFDPFFWDLIHGQVKVR